VSALSTRIVFRNTGLLVIAQALAAPLSVLVNAVAARKLGAEDYGLLFQSLAFSTFAFLFVEWGQSAVLTAKVATQRQLAGRFLGSALAFRLAAAILVGLLVLGVFALARYPPRFIAVLSLSMVMLTFGTVVLACQDTMRGFERAELAAGTYVAWQLMGAGVVMPVLLLGAGIYGFQIAQICCAAVGCSVVLWLLPRLKVPALEVDPEVIRDLFLSGRPFLIFGIVLLLQPLVDSAWLSELLPPPSKDVGWYAAARKLIGALSTPASALTASLYPTLVRLKIESMQTYRRTVADALYAVTVMVVPVALGCALFPALGISIFGQSSYAPAERDLVMLAPNLAFVYLSMPVGACLASSGRQSVWTVVQMGSVVFSLIFDPIAIHWFLRHQGNGGLGVCLVASISELLMLTGGLVLLPPGILRLVPWSRLAAVVLSGGVMAAVAYGSTWWPEAVRAMAASAAYAICLQLSGGFDFRQTRVLLREIRGR
jgi:O-antigen/teichoic acid export membrane protein